MNAPLPTIRDRDRAPFVRAVQFRDAPKVDAAGRPHWLPKALGKDSPVIATVKAFNELRREKDPSRADQMPPVPQAAVVPVDAHFPVAPATAAKLTALETERTRLQAVAEGFSPDVVRRRIREGRENLAAQPGVTAADIEKFEAQCASHFQSAPQSMKISKEAVRRHSREVVAPACAEVLRSLIPMAEARLAELQKANAEQSAAVGIRPEPSRAEYAAFWRLMRLSERIAELETGAVVGLPSNLLAGFVKVETAPSAPVAS